VEEAVSNNGLLERLLPRRPPTVTFERDFRSYDARAFNTDVAALCQGLALGDNQTTK
jgi:hypothetical protein